MTTDIYSTFAKEGGRIGSGALGRGYPLFERIRELGGGQGGVARCAR